MTIPGRGDLSPPRRHGRAFGRRRGGGRRVLVLLVAAAVVGGGWFGWQALRGGSTPRPAAATTACTTPAAAPAPLPPPPTAVRVAVRNGTTRDGLARDVATQLRARGFVVVAVGNAAAPVPGASQVRYAGPTGLAAATTLVEHVPGAVRIAAAGLAPGVVELDLGGSFTALAPTAVAAAAHARDLAAASPRAAASPTSSPSPCATARG